jgi:hypothetical protein
MAGQEALGGFLALLLRQAEHAPAAQGYNLRLPKGDDLHV